MESLFRAAENNTIRMNYLNVKTDKTQENSKYTLYGEKVMKQ